MAPAVAAAFVVVTWKVTLALLPRRRVTDVMTTSEAVHCDVPVLPQICNPEATADLKAVLTAVLLGPENAEAGTPTSVSVDSTTCLVVVVAGVGVGVGVGVEADVYVEPELYAESLPPVVPPAPSLQIVGPVPGAPLFEFCCEDLIHGSHIVEQYDVLHSHLTALVPYFLSFAVVQGLDSDLDAVGRTPGFALLKSDSQVLKLADQVQSADGELDMGSTPAFIGQQLSARCFGIKQRSLNPSTVFPPLQT